MGVGGATLSAFDEGNTRNPLHHEPMEMGHLHPTDLATPDIPVEIAPSGVSLPSRVLGAVLIAGYRVYSRWPVLTSRCLLPGGGAARRWRQTDSATNQARSRDAASISDRHNSVLSVSMAAFSLSDLLYLSTSSRAL